MQYGLELSTQPRTLPVSTGFSTSPDKDAQPAVTNGRCVSVQSVTSYQASGDDTSNHSAGSEKSKVKRLLDYFCCVKRPEPEKPPIVSISISQLSSASKNGCLNTPELKLVNAVLYGTAKDVEAILTEDRVNRVQYQNRPLLLWTCEAEPSENLLAMQKLLLEKGADVYGTDSDSGFTALHIAALDGLVDSVKQLFEHGGKKLLAMKDNGGWTALMHAAVNGQKQENQAVYQFLVDKGAKPDAAWKDSEGNRHTPADVLRRKMEIPEGVGGDSSQSDCLHGFRRLRDKVADVFGIRGG